MNMRDLERWGMAEEVWVKGERKKYYRAESDMWQVIRNVLNSRERREVQLAIQVLSESVSQLQSAREELTPEERDLAEYYLERIADLQSFFQFAQLALETVLGTADTFDFEEVSKIEIG